MLSGLIWTVRIALSAALELFPTASDTTFTAQFYRQSREKSLFPAVSATTFTVQFCRQSSENPLFPVAPDTTFTVQFYRQDRGKSLFPAVSAIPLLFNFTDKAGENHCFLQCQPYLYCSILQTKQGKSTVSCSVNHIFYSRLSPKMAFLISFSWSKTKRATMALSSAVEGSLILDADFKRSRTLFRSESIYTVASLESRAL